MTDIAGKTVSTPDLVLMGTGAVMLVDGFLPWYGVDLGPIGSFNIKGFSAGFLGWASILLIVAAGALVAARVFAAATLPAGKIGPALAVLAASGLGTLLVVLRLLTQTSLSKFGLFLGIVLAVTQTFFAFGLFRASGEAMPDFRHGAAPTA
jgi:hypothetical protein